MKLKHHGILTNEMNTQFQLSHHAKIYINKKGLPKQKTIQNFNIDAQGFTQGNRSCQVISAGRSAPGRQVGRYGLASNSYFLCRRIFISCFSEPLGINIEIMNGLFLW